MSDIYDSLPPEDRDGPIGSFYRRTSGMPHEDEPTDVEPREPGDGSSADMPNAADSPEHAENQSAPDSDEPPVEASKAPEEPEEPEPEAPEDPVAHSSTLTVLAQGAKPTEGPADAPEKSNLAKAPLQLNADDLLHARNRAMQSFKRTRHDKLTTAREDEVRAAVIGPHCEMLTDGLPAWFRNPRDAAYNPDADPLVLAQARSKHRDALETELRDFVKAGLPTPADAVSIEHLSQYAEGLGKTAGQEIRRALTQGGHGTASTPINAIADAYATQIEARLKALDLDERHLNLADTTTNTVEEREFVAKTLLQSASVLEGPHPIGSDAAIEFENQVQARFAEYCSKYQADRNQALREIAEDRGANVTNTSQSNPDWAKLEKLQATPLTDEELRSLYAEARLSVESDYLGGLTPSVRAELEAREQAIRQALEGVLYKRFVGKQSPAEAEQQAAPKAEASGTAEPETPKADEATSTKSTSSSAKSGNSALGSVALGTLGSATTGVLRLAGKGLNKGLDTARTAYRAHQANNSSLWGTPEPSQPAVREYRKNVATAATLLDQLIERGANESAAQRASRLQQAARYMDRALVSLPLVERDLEAAGLKKTKEILSQRLDQVTKQFPEDKDLLKAADKMRETLRERIQAAMERIQRVFARITDAVSKPAASGGSRGPRM